MYINFTESHISIRLDTIVIKLSTYLNRYVSFFLYMNRWIKILLIVFAIIIVLGLILPIFKINIISVDEKSYSQGKNITGHLSSFALSDCSCKGPELEVFRWNESSWVNLRNDIRFKGEECIDGIIKNYGLGCDVVYCELKLSHLKRDFTWEPIVYELNNSNITCKSAHNSNVTYNVTHYYMARTAPPGRYKFTYGRSKEIIEII